jgi:hypothetical protein
MPDIFNLNASIQVENQKEVDRVRQSIQNTDAAKLEIFRSSVRARSCRPLN